MNPIDVFLYTTTLKSDIKYVIEDGQLYLIEYDKTHTFQSKVHISSHRLYGTQYQRIKTCCDKRRDDPKMVFKCDRDCQVCIPYLLSKVYNYLYCPSILEKIPISPKSKLLEETLEEIFDEEATSASAAAPTAALSKHVSNPLDGAVVAFGKYKGRTFKDVFDLDKGYCMWCIENSSIKQFVEPHKKPLQNMVLFVSYVKQKFTE
jgi:hypothetical protein